MPVGTFYTYFYCDESQGDYKPTAVRFELPGGGAGISGTGQNLTVASADFVQIANGRWLGQFTGDLPDSVPELPLSGPPVNYSIKVTRADGKIIYRTGSATRYTLAVGRYTDSEAAEQIVGRDNLQQWLALENANTLADESTEIFNRLCFNLVAAESRADAILRGGTVPVPVLPVGYATGEILPRQFSDAVAKLLAVAAYEARGVLDFDASNNAPQHKLRYLKTDAETYLVALRNGRISQGLEATNTYPSARDESTEAIGYGDSQAPRP